jgi:hypothetical protein
MAVAAFRIVRFRIVVKVVTEGVLLVRCVVRAFFEK